MGLSGLISKQQTGASIWNRKTGNDGPNTPAHNLLHTFCKMYLRVFVRTEYDKCLALIWDIKNRKWPPNTPAYKQKHKFSKIYLRVLVRPWCDRYLVCTVTCPQQSGQGCPHQTGQCKVIKGWTQTGRLGVMSTIHEIVSCTGWP